MQRTEKTNAPKRIERKKFSILETIKTAWHDINGTKRVFWTVSAMLAVVICLLVLLEIKIVLLLLSPGLTALIIIVARVISAAISILFGLGLVYLGIQRTSHRVIEVGMIKDVFDLTLFKNVIGLYILQFIMLFPVAVLFYVSTHFIVYFPNVILNNFGEFGRSIIVVVSLIVLLHLLMRLSLTKAIIIAEKTSPWTAVRRSFMATKSHVWKLLGLFFFNIILITISVAPFGIGLLWTIPFCFINYGVVYKKLTS